MLGPEISFFDRDYIRYEGKTYLYLAGIDYHRISRSPSTITAMCEAAHEFGLNSTGSRSTTGNHMLYRKLEELLADFFETEAALILPSGYLANLVLLQTIADDFDFFFIDEKAHSSFMDIVYSFNRTVIKFNHLEANDLEHKIKTSLSIGSKGLIITDGVFSSTGAVPPINHYVQIAKRYECKIVIDDAHAMAVIGNKGKGSWEYEQVDRNYIFQTGTLSKGFGTFGGVILGTQKLIKSIQEKSSAFTGATGLPLPLIAAGISSVSHLLKNRQIILSLQMKATKLKKQLIELGFAMPTVPTPIFSITHYDETKNKRLYEELLENGIYPPFISYPGAPAGGHFRFIITSTTSDSQIKLLYQSIEASLVNR